jgi:hypothetical protein
MISLATTAGILAVVSRRSHHVVMAADWTPAGAGPHVRRVIPKMVLIDVPLRQAFEMLSQESGAVISVDWSAMKDRDVADWSPVTVELHDVTFLGALESILDQVQKPGDWRDHLGYQIDGDTITIDRSHDRPEPTDGASPPLVVRVYEVRSLLDLTYSPPRRGALGQGGGAIIRNTLFGPGTSPNYGHVPDEWASRFETLVSMLSRSANIAPGGIQYFSGQMIIVASEADQARVGRLLGELKRDLSSRSGGVPSR